MGKLILGPEWLFLLCYHSRTSSKPAREVYRAYVLLRKRGGHVLDLDSDRDRRTLEWSLKKGRVPHHIVACAGCATEAWLGDWVKAADMDTAHREAIMRDNKEHTIAGLLDFLKPCPGGNDKRAVHTPDDWPEVL